MLRARMHVRTSGGIPRKSDKGTRSRSRRACPSAAWASEQASAAPSHRSRIIQYESQRPRPMLPRVHVLRTHIGRSATTNKGATISNA